MGATVAVVTVLQQGRDAHVDDLDERPRGVARVTLGHDPVDTAQVRGGLRIAVVVGHPHGPQARSWRYAHDTDAVVDGADDARHVRPVTIPVADGVRVRTQTVMTTANVQVRVGVDAGVQDAHIDVDTFVVAVDAGRPGNRPHALAGCRWAPPGGSA